MIPGQFDVQEGEIELSPGRSRLTIKVANSGDRPIQVGSHYHFYETNPALGFEREATLGYRLDIPAGTAIRFEPGQTREVTLVAFAGRRHVYGFRAAVMGPLPEPADAAAADSAGSDTAAKGTSNDTAEEQS